MPLMDGYGMNRGRRTNPFTGHSHVGGGRGNFHHGNRRDHHRRDFVGQRHPYSTSNGRYPFIVGFKKLSQWSEMESEKLVTELFGKRVDFIKVFNKPNVKEDWVQLSITILANVAKSSAEALKKPILMEVSDKSSFWNFVIPNFLRQKSQFNHLRSINQSTTIGHKQSILKELITIIEALVLYCSKYVSSLPFPAIMKFAQEINENLLAARLLKLYQRAKKPLTANQPPNDYRQLPSFPTMDEMLQRTPSYLRPIRKNGKYDNALHYLDIQFRLLKEDLVSPLREGIHELSSILKNKNHNLKVYKGVEFVNINCTNSGLTFTIQFDTESTRGIFWKHTKKLIFGSLVCLSNDGFNTMVFACVAQRDPKELQQKGSIDLRFLDGLQAYHYLTQRNSPLCEMVECPSYFEAYKHVLDGLKELKEDDLPMEKYIVNSENDSEFPLYIKRNTCYNLSSIVLDENSNRYTNVQVKKPQYWPSTNSVVFNQSQYKAFHHALTNKFAIIQGPPGTGKTFVALKIVDTLLRNKENWQRGEKTGPMLIVCYTNHALDQFLNGLIEHGHDNIIRVGGRADPSLDEYLLRTKIQNQDKQLTGYIRKSKYESHKYREAVEEQLDPHLERLYAHHGGLVNGKLLTMNHLAAFIPRNHQSHFQKYMSTFAGSQFSVFDYFLNVYNLEKDDMIAAKNITSPTNAFNQLQITERVQLEELVDIEGEGQALVDKWAVDETQFTRKKKRTSAKETEVNTKKITSYDGFVFVLPNKRERKNLIRKQMKAVIPMKEVEAKKISDPWSLPVKERWRLYMYYVNQCNDQYFQQISNLADDFEEACQTLKELKEQEDEQVLRTADVIAMTTTCAARYRRILKNIGPKIVVIEEAAEVLEAHVVTSLTPSTEHVILIGDHKQLRPNPSVHELAKKFNLELSLFERMINNGLECQTLNVQHRMRPQISTLIRNVYPDLRDHPKVSEYPHVMGVEKDVIFLSHESPETQNAQNSKSNLHEAEFLVALCRYLLQQGYQASQITILTGYSGQLTTMKKLMPKNEFNGVRVTTVDNFQGEENYVILLSLVRSNNQGNIGFLGTENRVNVALSRAKHGLYVIGNFDLLEKKTLLWKNIVKDCREMGYLAKSMKLCCQNHPDTKLCVTSANDFKGAPEGGCLLKCNYMMKCGHSCWKKCHPADPDHVMIKCRTNCPNKCNQGHMCPSLCHYRQRCPPCTRQVMKIIPKCGHKISMQCRQDPIDVICTKPCGKVKDCGHVCKGICGEDCRTVACNQDVEKILSCGHKAKVECSKNVSLIYCQQICVKEKKCGHQIRYRCSSSWLLDQPCKEKVQKKLSNCKHSKILDCSQDVTTVICDQRMKVKFPCDCIKEVKCNDRSKGNLRHSCIKIEIKKEATLLLMKDVSVDEKEKINKIIDECKGHSHPEQLRIRLSDIKKAITERRRQQASQSLISGMNNLKFY